MQRTVQRSVIAANSSELKQFLNGSIPSFERMTQNFESLDPEVHPPSLRKKSWLYSKFLLFG